MSIQVQDRSFQRGTRMRIARDTLGCPREAQRPYRSAAKPPRIERGRLNLLGREGIAAISASIQKCAQRSRWRTLGVHTAPMAYDALPTCYHTPKVPIHAMEVFLLDDRSSPAAGLQFWPRYTLLTTSRPCTPAYSRPIPLTASYIIATAFKTTTPLSTRPTSRDIMHNLVCEMRRLAGRLTAVLSPRPTGHSNSLDTRSYYL